MYIFLCYNKYMENKNIYKPKEFSKKVKRSVHTLQRWDREGKLIAHRTNTNRRYYTHEQFLEVMGLKPEAGQQKIVIYARVSSHNQKSDLNNQIEFLKQYANANGIIVSEILTDIGSGLNYNRKNFNKILYSDDITTVIISYKDRFVRFGYDWFFNYLKYKDVNIIVVNNISTSPEKELVEDLISIITVFSSRIYGLRKYKNKIKKDIKIE